MSKAVLLSIQPQWCELIVAGKKTIEVRKTAPKLETPFKCYIYQTKHKWLYEHLIRLDRLKTSQMLSDGQCKVIGEFVCDHVDKVTAPFFLKLYGSCLSAVELHEYSQGKPLYGWYISDLVIYDKPRELSEFYKNGTLSNEAFCEAVYDGKRNYADYLFTRAMRKPPQSWCYVEELPGGAADV